MTLLVLSRLFPKPEGFASNFCLKSMLEVLQLDPMHLPAIAYHDVGGADPIARGRDFEANLALQCQRSKLPSKLVLKIGLGMKDGTPFGQRLKDRVWVDHGLTPTQSFPAAWT